MITKKDLLAELDQMLDDGVAWCGSMPPAEMDAAKALREELKALVMRHFKSLRVADMERLRLARLGRLLDAYLSAGEYEDDEDFARRNYGEGR
jgi:hypothetical protein